MFKSAEHQSVARIGLSLIGAAIGTLSMLAIYPRDMAVHGLSVFLLNFAMTASPFIMLGIGGIAVNFYNEFKTDDKKDHGFLGFLFLILAGGALLFSIVFLLTKDYFLKYFYASESQYNQYFIYIVPLAIAQAGCAAMDIYLNNFLKAFIPSFFREFLIRLTQPILFLAYLSGWLSVEWFVLGLVINYIIGFIALLMYTWFLRKESFNVDTHFLQPERLKRITQYGSFIVLYTIASQLLTTVDVLMIKAILPTLNVLSVYSLNMLLSSFIFLPTSAIVAVAGPKIASYIADKNMGGLSKIYTSTSTILLILGVFLTGLIFISLNDIYALMKNGELYRMGFYTFLFLALGKLIEMSTGLNTQIIVYSKYYKYNLYVILLMVSLNLFLNYVLIHLWGITGAAVANCTTLALFNLFKLVFIKKKFGLWPFNFQDLKILILSLTLIGLCYMIPNFFGRPFFDIILKCLCFSIIFWIAVLKLRLSESINNYYNDVMTKMMGHDRFNL